MIGLLNNIIVVPRMVKEWDKEAALQDYKHKIHIRFPSVNAPIEYDDPKNKKNTITSSMAGKSSKRQVNSSEAVVKK